MSNEGVIPFNAWNIKEIGQDGALRQLSKSELLHRLAGLNTFSDADSDGGSSSELEQVEQSEPFEQLERFEQKYDDSAVARMHAADPQQSQSYAQACNCPAAVSTPLVPLVPCETGLPSLRGPDSALSPNLRYGNTRANGETWGVSRHGIGTVQPARERLPSVGSVPSELSDEDDFDICDNDNDISTGDDGDDSLCGTEPQDTSSCSAASSVASSPIMAASRPEPGSAPQAAPAGLGASWCVATAQAPVCNVQTRGGAALNEWNEAQLHRSADMDWDVVGM